MVGGRIFPPENAFPFFLPNSSPFFNLSFKNLPAFLHLPLLGMVQIFCICCGWTHTNRINTFPSKALPDQTFLPKVLPDPRIAGKSCKSSAIGHQLCQTCYSGIIKNTPKSKTNSQSVPVSDPQLSPLPDTTTCSNAITDRFLPFLSISHDPQQIFLLLSLFLPANSLNFSRRRTVLLTAARKQTRYWQFCKIPPFDLCDVL